eukprot:794724-Pelagomonas_calceolata.AAC.1
MHTQAKHVNRHTDQHRLLRGVGVGGLVGEVSRMQSYDAHPPAQTALCGTRPAASNPVTTLYFTHLYRLLHGNGIGGLVDEVSRVQPDDVHPQDLSSVLTVQQLGHAITLLLCQG